MKRHVILAVAASAAALAVSVAGAAGQVVAPINVTNSQFAANEESLGMDPSGALLAGAWNDWHFNDGCGFSYSTDGGDTWAPESFVPGMTKFTNDPNVPGLNTTFAIAGDPSVAYNPKFGDFVVMCQAFGSATGNQIQLLSTTFDPAKVTDRNDTNGSYGLNAWRLPASAVTTGASKGSQKGSNGKLPDHESITVDTNRTSPFYGRVYVGWAEFSGAGRSPIDLAFSDDDGATWTGPVRVSDNGHQFDQDARPSVAPNGDVYLTWINGPNEGSLKNNVAMADVSHDGGVTWGADAVVAPIPGAYSGGLPNSLYRVFSDVWSTTDASGRLIVAFTDRSTGASQVFTTHSLQPNSLAGFATAAQVNPTGQEQFFPWLSAAPNGRVDLVYYDRSCDPSGDKLNCVTLSSTTNGGLSWSSVPLLGTGFDGDMFETCVAFVEPPDCGTHFLGDYIAVASTNSKAQALWTGNGPHAMDVFSSRVTFP